MFIDLSHPHRSSSTPVNGREREEAERQQGGTPPIPYNGKENRKDGKVDDELEATVVTVPDQDGDIQHDSGLADSSVSEGVMVARLGIYL